MLSMSPNEPKEDEKNFKTKIPTSIPRLNNPGVEKKRKVGLLIFLI